MRVAVPLRLANEDWTAARTYVEEAERLGADSVWSAESWGHDAVTPLGYLAACTSRIRLGAGIVQSGTRTPALVAMTALSLAAMSGNRFIHAAFQRAGYREVALEAQRLWLDGRREEAALLVPDALVLGTNLLGTEAMVRERLRAYRAAGVTTLRVEPAGASLDERLQTLARVIALVREVAAEGP